VFSHTRSLIFYRTEWHSKVKQSRYTPWRRMGGEEVQLLLILNLCTRWGEWSASRPGRALPLGKEPPVPIVQQAGWAPELVWTQRLEEKSSASVGDRTSIVQSVVRHYTDWAWLTRCYRKIHAGRTNYIGGCGLWTHGSGCFRSLALGLPTIWQWPRCSRKVRIRFSDGHMLWRWIFGSKTR
jgi:hypothetical protein